MKLRQLLIIPLLCFLISFTPDYEFDKSAVKNTAIENLQIFLNKIPEGKEEAYGFKSREEFLAAKVGQAYQVVTLSKKFYDDSQISNEQYLVFQNEWRVPVLVNSENRTLLTVNKLDNTFKVVDLGGALLVKEIADKTKGVDEVKNVFILRIYPLAIDFLLIASDQSLNDASVVPLTSALNIFPALAHTEKISLNNLLPIIKQQYQLNYKK